MTGEQTDHGHRRLLPARRERPRGRAAAEQGDELAPFHSITSSARASSVAGTSRPSAFAVLRLINRRRSISRDCSLAQGISQNKHNS